MRWLVIWLATVLLVFATPSAVAQNQSPMMGSEASPDLPIVVPPAVQVPAANLGSETTEFRILVIGDELAGGLGAGMIRMAENDPNFRIVNRFNELSGLARTELYDWPTSLAKITLANPVDAVVVLVGINDRQAIRNDTGRLAFRSAGWSEAYTSSIDRLADAVKAANAKLYWISIPPIANPRIDADMRFLSDIQRVRVAAKGGHFIDVRPFFLAADGSFTERGPDEKGNIQKLRQRDGIKFMTTGNSRFGQLVLGAIKTIEGKSEPVVSPQQPETPVAAVVAPQPVVQSTSPANTNQPLAQAPPTFGQEGLDGEQITFRADAAIGKPALETKSVDQKPVGKAVVKDVAAILSAKFGTKAFKLLIEGLSPVAPEGRFDDFSVPALK